MKNICYAQSGGPTAVINESARGVIETARAHPDKIGTVYAGLNGISGVMNENLIDTNLESDAAIAGLRHTPAAAFYSCRHKLKCINEQRDQYQRLIDVFKAHNIGYFLYNGGGDSQDTAYKISQISSQLGYDLQCIGIPKTIDNDLALTDCSPGFASAAKYLATSIREASYDLASMAASSTKVFILEVMGRHTGWLAAATGIATDRHHDAPHIILFPEQVFNPELFLKKVQACVKQYGFCTIVVSEGIKDQSGHLVQASTKSVDEFGHAQLGGVALVIANLVKKQLGFKYHYAVADYLQRAARHIASKTDLEHAYAVGKKAVELALAGENAMMATIVREHNSPYAWRVDSAPLKEIANFEKTLPKEFINEEGFHITQACRDYLLPLIQGEDSPPYLNGLPEYTKLEHNMIEKKLPELELQQN